MYVPDINLKLVPKPAANPVYSLVSCGLNNSRYAIRWNNKYLTLVDPSTGQLQWTDTKSEPNSCFVTQSGYCGSSDYIMLYSAVNTKFLRANDSGTLLCADQPTQNTAQQFCWKLRAAPSVNTSAACGCQYNYSVKAVVCTPCGVTTSAAPVLTVSIPGPWPELVGWDVNAANVFLAGKYPTAAIIRIPCPAASSGNCPLTVSPPPNQPLILLRYQPETGRVLFVPSMEPPRQQTQQPLVVRV